MQSLMIYSDLILCPKHQQRSKSSVTLEKRKRLLYRSVQSIHETSNILSRETRTFNFVCFRTRFIIPNTFLRFYETESPGMTCPFQHHLLAGGKVYLSDGLTRKVEIYPGRKLADRSSKQWKGAISNPLFFLKDEVQ